MPKISMSSSWLLLGCLGIGVALMGCRPGPGAGAPDYRVFVVEQGRGELSAFEASSGKLSSSVRIGYNPHEIAVTRDGKTAYVSNFGIEDYDHTIGVPGKSISVIDLATMTVRDSFLTVRPEGDAGPSPVSMAPHGVRLRPPMEEELFVNVEVGDSMLVYDAASGRIKRAFPLPPGSHNFIFTPDGNTIWLFAGRNGVYRIDPDTGNVTARFQTYTAVRGLIFSNDHRNLIISAENEIYLYSLADMKLERRFQNLGVKQIIYSAQTPDGRYILAPCPYDGVVLVIDYLSGEVVRRLPTGKAPIYVQIAPEGRQAYVSNALDDHMSVIDLENFKVRRFGEVSKPNGFAFLNGGTAEK